MSTYTLSLSDDIYMLDGIQPRLPVYDLVQKYSRLQSTGTSEDVYIFYWYPIEYRTDFSTSRYTLELDTLNTFDTTNNVIYVDSIVGQVDLSISFPALSGLTLLINDVTVTFTTNESSLDLVITKINSETDSTDIASKVTFGSIEYIKLIGCTLYHTGTANVLLGLPTTIDYTIAKEYHDGNLVKGFEIDVFLRNINYDPSDTTLVRTNATQSFYWRVKPRNTFMTEVNYLTKWGSYGSGSGYFNNPIGITTDSLGNIFVVDQVNNRVQKFNSSGVYQSQFGTPGSGNGQFDFPYGITTDSLDNIYVTDFFNNRVQKFNSSGVYQSQFGTPGSGNGQFNGPEGISTDSLNNIYVVDTGNSRIQKFSSVGTYTLQWGSLGSGNSEFILPQGIVVDSSNKIYVADTSNYRIQKFDSVGMFIIKWGSNGTGDGQFNSPYDISSDSLGNVYVTDTVNNRIQKFSSTGVFIVKWGSAGSGSGYFNNPKGITVNRVNKNIYVSDTGNYRIQKFSCLEWLNK